MTIPVTIVPVGIGRSGKAAYADERMQPATTKELRPRKFKAFHAEGFEEQPVFKEEYNDIYTWAFETASARVRETGGNLREVAALALRLSQKRIAEIESKKKAAKSAKAPEVRAKSMAPKKQPLKPKPVPIRDDAADEELIETVFGSFGNVEEVPEDFAGGQLGSAKSPSRVADTEDDEDGFEDGEVALASPNGPAEEYYPNGQEWMGIPMLGPQPAKPAGYLRVVLERDRRAVQFRYNWRIDIGREVVIYVQDLRSDRCKDMVEFFPTVEQRDLVIFDAESPAELEEAVGQTCVGTVISWRFGDFAMYQFYFANA